MSSNDWPKWVRDDNSVVSCTEKVKVMTENFDELKQIAQETAGEVAGQRIFMHRGRRGRNEGYPSSRCVTPCTSWSTA